MPTSLAPSRKVSRSPTRARPNAPRPRKTSRRWSPNCATRWPRPRRGATASATPPAPPCPRAEPGHAGKGVQGMDCRRGPCRARGLRRARPAPRRAPGPAPTGRRTRARPRPLLREPRARQLLRAHRAQPAVARPLAHRWRRAGHALYRHRSHPQFRADRVLRRICPRRRLSPLLWARGRLAQMAGSGAHGHRIRGLGAARSASDRPQHHHRLCQPPRAGRAPPDQRRRAHSQFPRFGHVRGLPRPGTRPRPPDGAGYRPGHDGHLPLHAAQHPLSVVAFSGKNDPHIYTQAIAWIRAEHPDLMRSSCVHEELAQGLGLADDSPAARPSIFNDDDEFALLTTHDEELLRLLYSPDLKPGMTPDEARPIIRRLLDEWQAGPV